MHFTRSINKEIFRYSFMAILFLWVPFNASFAQLASEIKAYATKIDSLQQAEMLEMKEYPDMSLCGGALSGWFFQDELVKMETVKALDSGYEKTMWWVRGDSLLMLECSRLRIMNSSEESDSTFKDVYFGCDKFDCEQKTFLIIRSVVPEIHETLNNQPVVPYSQGRVKSFFNCFEWIVQEMKSL